jgi:hypothetical protein
MADLEECTGIDTAAAASSDVPLVVQVLHDAQVMFNRALAFEQQQQDEQKSQPEPERDAVSLATATVATSHEQAGPPLSVTPTVLLQSEAEEWAHLLHRREQQLPTVAIHSNTSTRNNQAIVELLYQDFTALYKNAS